MAVNDLKRQLQPPIVGTLQALRTLESLDRQYGGHAPLALEGVEEVVSAALTHLAWLSL